MLYFRVGTQVLFDSPRHFYELWGLVVSLLSVAG